MPEIFVVARRTRKGWKYWCGWFEGTYGGSRNAAKARVAWTDDPARAIHFADRRSARDCIFSIRPIQRDHTITTLAPDGA